MKTTVSNAGERSQAYPRKHLAAASVCFTQGSPSHSRWCLFVRSASVPCAVPPTLIRVRYQLRSSSCPPWRASYAVLFWCCPAPPALARTFPPMPPPQQNPTDGNNTPCSLEIVFSELRSKGAGAERCVWRAASLASCCWLFVRCCRLVVNSTPMFPCRRAAAGGVVRGACECVGGRAPKKAARVDGVPPPAPSLLPVPQPSCSNVKIASWCVSAHALRSRCDPARSSV